MNNSSNGNLSVVEDTPTVLLVEDNFLNQKVASALLHRLGLKVKLATNGKEAVDAVVAQRFSLILMDCHMPIMDGFEASVAIRKLEDQTGQYTPIIAITALAMGGDRERCIAAGMNDYLPKPIDKDLLKVKINHWLRTDVVYQSQKMRRKLVRPTSVMTVIEGKPIDLDELEEFFGAEQLQELVDVFLTHTADMISRVKTQIFERNPRAVAGIAHEIKASCASIGAKQLARLCLYLEQASVQHDWMEVSETLSSIERTFETLKSYIENQLDKPASKVESKS
ncbi:MAG: response regulator [Candidatus Obscuribacter sp.]|jgi:two-component system sensor histidine kinase/response regulator|nr:response regulator [Candidatus Obscuribacter sp.]MDQ5965222.1 Response regulator [Cyanobacteriota bacterium erpe_2018_sw_39hr_WHONDRS-SW48-000098_B_bin.30]MBK7838384.1 response regulator [Candidatus Obscuribacter sp.]MBK9201110.1 response regulator [Candidatus Obscuribacter sp.]MBK9621775.1 response regulator [Candidatus Obscuribacter sp.]